MGADLPGEPILELEGCLFQSHLTPLQGEERVWTLDLVPIAKYYYF